MNPSRRNKKESRRTAATVGGGSSGGGQLSRKSLQPRSAASESRPTLVSATVLRRRLPLPQPDEDGDKEERGAVLIIGGSAEMPGAVLLAAEAALRAGAGKLQIATVKSIAPHIGAMLPEARVFALAETRSGAVAASCADELAERAARVQSIAIGPGMVDEAAVTRLMEKLVPRFGRATVTLDAAALACLAANRQLLHALHERIVITPHAGEMASISGLDKETVRRDSLSVARRLAVELRAVVALKGRETFIVSPIGEAYCNRAGNIGLATSGSGDLLSGLIAGLGARGAVPLRAAVWGVHLHARAGDKLARRIGPLGFLARELLAEVPALLAKIDNR